MIIGVDIGNGKYWMRKQRQHGEVCCKYIGRCSVFNTWVLCVLYLGMRSLNLQPISREHCSRRSPSKRIYDQWPCLIWYRSYCPCLLFYHIFLVLYLSLLAQNILVLSTVNKQNVPFPCSCLRTAVSLAEVVLISLLAFIVHLEMKIKYTDEKRSNIRIKNTDEKRSGEKVYRHKGSPGEWPPAAVLASHQLLLL